jgi:3-phenylpropionate/trans-cinnamate dioxygenase ferredoxin reductase subunit
LQTFDVLIVGGGQGGAQAAIYLRQRKFSRSIAVLGEEYEVPYERPTLSKDYLSGEKDLDRIRLRPEKFWDDREITMMLGQRIVSVNARHKEVATAFGESLRFNHLIWATGGHARRLSCEGGDLQGVHSIRSRADVDRMRPELTNASRVVIIGGGYIGLEAAAVLTKLNKQVTVLEMQARVLARVAGEELSRFYEKEHRARGVELRLATTVDRIEGTNGRAVGVRLSDGEIVPCDVVIVGVGIVPAVAPLQKAGAECIDGVSVDAFCRTNLPDVFAIGDCARHSNMFAAGEPVRLESIQNANDMALTAAKAITGEPEPYRAVPWFWSNQYDIKLQTVGLSMRHDAAIVRGDPACRSFSIVYCRDGRVVALDCVNRAKDFVQGRSLITAGSVVDASSLADPNKPLTLAG